MTGFHLPPMTDRVAETEQPNGALKKKLSRLAKGFPFFLLFCNYQTKLCVVAVLTNQVLSFVLIRRKEQIMELDITYIVKHRHTAKAYDASRKIPASEMEKIKQLLRYSPSSTNAQPWHFVILSDEAAKNRVARANEAMFAFNNPSIRAASHVVVFCSKLNIEDDHLARILAQEEADGRFATDPSLKAKMDDGRKFFVNLHKNEFKDVQHWIDKQVYLNAGQFLLGVAALGIDATPMEGIDRKSIDAELGLNERGYTSLLIITLGYHDRLRDYNAKTPKSRLPYREILTEL